MRAADPGSYHVVLREAGQRSMVACIALAPLESLPESAVQSWSPALSARLLAERGVDESAVLEAARLVVARRLRGRGLGQLLVLTAFALAQARGRRMVWGTAGTRQHQHHLLIATGMEIREVGALTGAGDRIAYLDPNLHREITRGLLWTPEEVRAHPAGLDVATLELDPTDLAGLRLAGQWRVMEALDAIGGGRALGDISRARIASASAVGLITVPGTDRNAYFAAGRAIQRMWLTATALGVAIQPMTTLPYLLARAGRGGGDRLTDRSLAELAGIRPSFDRLFETPPDQAETFLFRIFFADPPTARSRRRPLTDILTLV
jgi:GNAT superfamily N-acetyltransferase